MFILRNFKSNDFVGAYSKGFAEAFFVSAHSKGFASARVGQGVTIFAFKATSEVNTVSTGNSSLAGMGCGKCAFEIDEEPMSNHHTAGIQAPEARLRSFRRIEGSGSV